MIQQTKQHNKESEFAFRPGQHQALEAIIGFLKSSRESSYILATGSFGKTILYIKAVQKYQELNPDKNQVLVLAGSISLLGQLEQEFKVHAPGLSVARVTGEIPPSKADVTFASIQRCRSLLHEGKLDGLLRPLVIVDEAHALLGHETQKLVSYMLQNGCRIFGGTATDEYYADKKLSAVLGPPCYTLTYREALELKVVAPFSTSAITLPFDMSHVRKIAGDYDRAALSALFRADVCADAIARYHHQYHPEKKGYVQCLSRHHARITAAYLSKQGIPSAAVTGDLPGAEQERIIRQAKEGKLQLLCGKNLLIEGIDWVDASIAYNFPSASNLAVKQRGFRVTRLNPNDPDKCATIVEIIPTQISKTKPPLMFREAVDGGIYLKGSSSSRPGKSHNAKAPRDKIGLFPVEADAVAIINEVLQGSGPWAKFNRELPAPKRLQEMISQLHDRTLAFLNKFAEHDQFTRAISTLACWATRELRSSDCMPMLSSPVESAIDELSIIDLPAEERIAALREIQRFLFGPVKFRKDTDTVSALGLSPAVISELLPQCLKSNDADPFAEIMETLTILNLLNDMDASVSTLAEVFEPLIECQAALRGLNRVKSSADSDWYFLGAKTLMESILIHDCSATKRFESHLNSRIAAELSRLKDENASSSEKDGDLSLLYMDPRQLDLRPTGHQKSIFQCESPEDGHESLLAHLKMKVDSWSGSQAARSRRHQLAGIFVEALIHGSPISIEDLTDDFHVSTVTLRDDMKLIRRGAQDWLKKYNSAIED
jgi:superfamily II DNA or RNA helicase